MSGIGEKVTHTRYGLAKVTNTWFKWTDPVRKTRRLVGLTFELLTSKGIALYRRDRGIFFVKDKALPRCYEGNLAKVELYVEKD